MSALCLFTFFLSLAWPLLFEDCECLLLAHFLLHFDLHLPLFSSVCKWSSLACFLSLTWFVPLSVLSSKWVSLTHLFFIPWLFSPSMLTSLYVPSLSVSFLCFPNPFVAFSMWVPLSCSFPCCPNLSPYTFQFASIPLLLSISWCSNMSLPLWSLASECPSLTCFLFLFQHISLYIL